MDLLKIPCNQKAGLRKLMKSVWYWLYLSLLLFNPILNSLYVGERIRYSYLYRVLSKIVHTFQANLRILVDCQQIYLLIKKKKKMPADISMAGILLFLFSSKYTVSVHAFTVIHEIKSHAHTSRRHAKLLPLCSLHQRMTQV